MISKELAGGAILVVVIIGLVLYILYPKPTSSAIFTALAAAGLLGSMVKTISIISSPVYERQPRSYSGSYVNYR